MKKEHFNYGSYKNYLSRQTRTSNRTISKTLKGKDFIQERIKELAFLYPNHKNVLCLGSRHPIEVETFLNNGFTAIGIDLFETLPHIIKCDMAKICDNETLQKRKPFDIIYMSHSLEHCLNVEGLLQGIQWSKATVIYIRVPIRTQPNKWDCTLLEFMLPDGDQNSIEQLFTGWKLKTFTSLKSEKIFILEKG